MSEIINDQSLRKLVAEQVDKIKEIEKLSDYEYSIKSIPCTGSNYTGALFYITLKNIDNHEIKLFAKIANLSQFTRQYMPIDKMYEREQYIYKDLAPIYDKIQDEHEIPDKQRYKFAKHYFSNDKVLEESVILENLTASGYVAPDRFKIIDWNLAAKSIETLAKFHALSFVFETEQPDIFKNTVKTKEEFLISKSKNVDKDTKGKYQENMFKRLFENVKPEHSETMKTYMSEYSENEWLSYYKIQRRPVLTHGDYRISNLMIKYEGDKVEDVIPVDYQTAHYGSPINDLLYFIFTGTDEEFRRKHYDDLIEHYYKSLSNVLDAMNVSVAEVYPKEDFDADLKERIMYGLQISLFILPYILAEEKPNLDKNLEEISVHSGGIFGERLNGIVSDFRKWGYL